MDLNIVKEQFAMTASEAVDKANGKMIPVLEISMDRVYAVFEAAKRYCNGEHQYAIPNGKFSDAEVELWSLFNRAFWFDPEGK